LGSLALSPPPPALDAKDNCDENTTTSANNDANFDRQLGSGSGRLVAEEVVGWDRRYGGGSRRGRGGAEAMSSLYK